jgi:deoxyhypusine synthase
MASREEKPGAPPSSATVAVLVNSKEMPEGSQKVEELDFNKFSGRQITVDDILSGMSNMGFQASSIGQAVKIINEMVNIFFPPAPIAILPSGPEHSAKLNAASMARPQH